MTIYGQFSEKFEKLWKKTTLKERGLLFYYSLFDYESFEQGVGTNFMFIIKKYNDELINLIKKLDKNFFHHANKESFSKKVAGDFLVRSILCRELSNRGIKVKKEDKISDLCVKDNIHIEIKRLTTTRQLREYIESIKNKKIKDEDRLGVLLLFPVLKDGEKERIEELTFGYYSLNTYLGAKMIICCVTKTNFEEVITKIQNNLGNFK